jgi:hypothetical protein
MASEVFTGKGKPQTTPQPLVTNRKNGTVAFSKAARDLLNDAASVELLFDKEARRMGIRPAIGHVPHADAPHSHGNASEFAAPAFFRRYAVDTASSWRYPARREGGLLVIDLTGERAAARAGKRRVRAEKTPARRQQ